MEKKLQVIPIMHGEGETYDYVHDIVASSRETRLRLYRGIIEYLEMLKSKDPNNDFSRYKLYCDGYDGTQNFVLDDEEFGNCDFAASTQLYLLSVMVRNGARLMVTENRSLVRQTDRLIMTREREIRTGRVVSGEQTMKRVFGLMQQRDDSMSKRIADTLHIGDEGLLFIGAAHNPIPYLAKRRLNPIVPSEIFAFLTAADLRNHSYLEKYQSLAIPSL